MYLDFPDAAQGACSLLRAAEVERAFDAERAQHSRIGLGEMAEMVGAKDLPPTHDAAILAGIATEITEIAGAGKIEMAGGGLGHRGKSTIFWDGEMTAIVPLMR